EMAPPELGVPVCFTPFLVSSSNSPSGTRHAMSPVFALTAISSPHTDPLQLHIVSLFQKRFDGPGVLPKLGGAAAAGGAPASGGAAPRRPPPACRRPICAASRTLP